MKTSQRRTGPSSPATAFRDEIERLRASLRELGANWRRQPALIPIPIGGRSVPPQESPRPAPMIHFAFGRKKDKDGEANDDGESGSDSEDDPLDLPPIPSAVGDREPLADLLDGSASDADGVGAWQPLDAPAAGTSSDDLSADGAADAPSEGDLPAWSARSFAVPEAPAAGAPGTEPDEVTPWGSGNSDHEPTTFAPEVVDRGGDQPENLAWLPSGAGEETAPWALNADSPADDGQEAVVSFTETDAELEVIDDGDEIEPETPEQGAADSGLDSISEVLTVPDQPWTIPTLVVEEVVAFPPAAPIAPGPGSAGVPALQTRTFPLPEGEVVFRNLRAGFTDPARLLRHLAGEGHTGVLQVLGLDGANSYVVLVDGYVVAVASDRAGQIATSNRISFPNFPNSQDTINVITYPRQIARGLGLLLHAPVRFAGLGAMFVNLEGLRSYLSKYSSSGGLIVHAQEGIGVALFEDGKLVGAYANGNSPTSDLGQLRDLVKDLEAEIDVRFGGPQDLEPTPLDSLLSGHPL